MKYSLIILLLGLFLFSCEKRHDDGAISLSQEVKDSLLIEYIIKEFDFNQDSNHYRISKRDFRSQLDSINKYPSRKYYSYGSNEAQFKNYHFKSFLFDSHVKPPFVVEITNEKDQFIDFFTFTDENFYSGNTITSRKDLYGRSIERDSILRHKRNLEKNLNQLIRRLGLNNKKEILDFTKTLCGTLNMKEISQDSLKNSIKAICTQSDLALGDSIYSLVQEEQKLFFEKGQGDVLIVNTTYHIFLGYWRIWLEEDKHEHRLIIKTAFFSDILYNPIFM